MLTPVCLNACRQTFVRPLSVNQAWIDGLDASANHQVIEQSHSKPGPNKEYLVWNLLSYLLAAYAVHNVHSSGM